MFCTSAQWFFSSVSSSGGVAIVTGQEHCDFFFSFSFAMKSGDWLFIET